MVDHAARDGNECLGVLAPNLVDGLAAFLVAGVGDGAGVHDKGIGVGIAVGDVVARRLETRRQGVGLIQVDAAAEGFEGDLFVHFNFFAQRK